MGQTSMKHYFECDCNHEEHRFCVTSEDLNYDDLPPQLYFHVQMSQYRGILRRTWQAIRYIFGYKSTYGHWDTVNISEDDLDRLIVLFHQHRVKLNKSKNNTEVKNGREN